MTQRHQKSKPDEIQMTPNEHQDLLKRLFAAYLQVQDTFTCEPQRQYLAYDAVVLTGVRWSTLGSTLIEDELRELTNYLNAWLGALKRWHAWQRVWHECTEDEQWDLEHEFLTPLATYCMFQPSAIRDALTFVITNGMHQMALSLDHDRRDWLPLDQAPWEQLRYPTRRQKEEQLASTVRAWSEGRLLLTRLRQLDGAATRTATADFRNRASHSIAPRFSRGITRAVTRTIVQATRIQEDGSGVARPVPIPGAFAVRYSHGGTEPLDLDRMRLVNLAQFEIAVACHDLYVTILRSGCARAHPD